MPRACREDCYVDSYKNYCTTRCQELASWHFTLAATVATDVRPSNTRSRHLGENANVCSCQRESPRHKVGASDKPNFDPDPTRTSRQALNYGACFAGTCAAEREAPSACGGVILHSGACATEGGVLSTCGGVILHSGACATEGGVLSTCG